MGAREVCAKERNDSEEINNTTLQSSQNTNSLDADLHMTERATVPEGPVYTLNKETRAPFDSSTLLFAQVNTREGDFTHRENDTWTKERPT